MSDTSKQLFEAMPKEYAQALASIRTQALHAHDKIKMETSRLHIRNSENDTSSIGALCLEELDAREDISSLHLLDDLLSMLVVGHKITN